MNAEDVRRNIHDSVSEILKRNEGSKMTPDLIVGMSYYIADAVMIGLANIKSKDNYES